MDVAPELSKLRLMLILLMLTTVIDFIWVQPAAAAVACCWALAVLCLPGDGSQVATHSHTTTQSAIEFAKLRNNKSIPVLSLRTGCDIVCYG